MPADWNAIYRPTIDNRGSFRLPVVMWDQAGGPPGTAYVLDEDSQVRRADLAGAEGSGKLLGFESATETFIAWLSRMPGDEVTCRVELTTGRRFQAQFVSAPDPWPPEGFLSFMEDGEVTHVRDSAIVSITVFPTEGQ